jgi:hypothetical protein
VSMARTLHHTLSHPCQTRFSHCICSSAVPRAASFLGQAVTASVREPAAESPAQLVL